MRASKRKIFLFALFSLNLVFSALPYDVRTAKAALPSAKVIFLTSAGSTNTWTVPSDWSNDNKIEVLGAGGGGRTGGASGSGGGGGGAYAAYTVSGLSSGGSVTYRVGAGGGAGANGGDTFFNRTAGSANTCADTVSVCAKGGVGATSATGAAGGAVASNKPANVGFSGGAGGTGNTTGDTGGGGGGAAGPHGIGLVGGIGQAVAPGAGGGGGGSGGGSAGSAGSTNGGAGGNGWRATGSGAGANATTNVNSVAGTNGGGGGGGAATSSAMTALRAGAAGSATGIVWTSTHAADGTTPSVVTAGPGGGGGGAGANTTNGTGSTGGNGGTYGGGGGGAYTTAGSGGQGIIVITYIPSTVTTKTIFLSSSPGSNATWTVPDDWSDDNEIVVLGAGGGGRSGTTAGAKGGGGGAVATSTLTGLSPGGSVTYRVGAGGGANTNGGDTFFNRTAGSANTCADTVSVCAKGGLAGTSATAGGTGGPIASNKPAYSGYTGGTGGNGNNTGDTGGGGGSGASILGAGRNGGASQGAAPGSGGGGGGAGGIGAAGASTIGGAGGAGFAGTGGGAGATWNPPTSAVAGTNGGGGGGGLGTTTVAQLPKRAGANGGNSTVWTSTHAADGVTPSVADIGPGGGGGGAGATTSNGTNSTGGTGGYGGGGGGAYTTGGTGGQGFIIIRYVPAGDPVDSYWVGGTGDWTDAATHWAATSNGSPGSGNLPGPTTNVHFDSNSGSGTITVNSASVEVADFDLSSSNITVDTSSNGITITGDATVNKTISGSTAVTFSGTGKTITGGNTGLISAPLTLGANATTTVSSGTFSITGIISGGFNLAKAGAGTLTLSGANSFSGGLTIREGTVRGETSASAFGGSGTGAITLGHSSGSANATLYAAYAGTIANPITVASGNSGVASIQSNSNSATAANFSGAITLNNNLTLTAFDTYPMEISGGITGTGNLIINETGVNGTAYEYIYLSTNPINMTGTITNSGPGNGSVTIASVIGTNVTGVIQNSATSGLTLSGNNTFTSGLTIRAGTVTGATSVNAFGASASVITLGHTSGSADTTLTNGSALTFANPITVAAGNSGTATIVTGDSSAATYSGAITLSNNLTLATAGGNSAGLTITGGITGTGNVIVAPQDYAYGIGVTLSTNPINMTGTITHNNGGGSGGMAYISSVIGTNVTGVVQDDPNYAMLLSGANTFTSGLTVRSGEVQGSVSSNAFGANASVITLGHTSGSANASIKADGRTFANPITTASGNTGTLSVEGNSSTFSGAITLNKDITLKNGGGNGYLLATGGITGTGNVYLNNQTSADYNQYVSLTTGAVNMVGAIHNISTGLTSNYVSVSSAVGTNVTGIVQNGTLPLTISGTNTYTGPVTNTSGTLKLAETNTFSTLTIGAGATTTITSGKTITVSSLVSNGSSGNLAYLNSSSAGSAGTLSKSSGSVAVSYLSIKDSTATGGASWFACTANGSVDVSGNTGWNFASCGDPIDAYWVGGTGNWSDAAAHWAATSNGTPGAANLPGATTNVYFDSNSGSGTVTINSAGVTVANFNNSTANITLATGANGITITGDMTVNGTVSGATAVTLNGSSKSITGTGTISAPVVLGATRTVNLSSGALVMSGIISDGGNAYGLVKTGTERLDLYGANTFTGGLNIKAGTVRGLTSANAFGANTSVITLGDTTGSANTTLIGFANVTFANPITVASGNSGTATIIAQGYDFTLSGAITLNNNLTFQTQYSYLSVTGGITGTGNIILNGQDTAVYGITLSTGSINNTGTITNSGSGNGASTISSIIGTNVTGVIQNSATSKLILSGANTFTSGLTIRAGTVEGNTSANAFGANASVITLGHASGSANTTLQSDTDGLTFANPISVASGNSGTASISLLNNYRTYTFSGAITLSNNLTLTASGADSSYGLGITGGITGTGNLILNTTSGSNISISTGAVNMVGTITNSGSGAGNASIGSVIGTNVTGVIQNSATSILYLSGVNTFTSGLTVRAGTVEGNTSGSAFGGSGTGAITLGHISGSANTTIQSNTDGLTFANPITVASGNSGTASISLPYTYRTYTFSGAVTLNNNLTLRSSAGDYGSLNITGGVSGTGNLVFQTSGGGGFINLSSTAINNTGSITNSGSGTAGVTISAPVGSGVTSVIQNSATSPLTLSGTNTYTGPVTSTLGTLRLAETNTFSTLTIGANATTTITSGKTITVSDLVSNGTSGNLAYLNSSSAGSAGTISKSSGSVAVSYLSIKDSTATGGASWFACTANGSVNVSGNTGWNFASCGGTPALSLLHYRWRNDSGPEDTAIYPLAEDTAISGNLLRGDRIRLRFLVSNTGDGSASGYTYRLESASTSCSAWIAVPNSTGENPHWVMDPSSFVLNSTLTTDSSGLTNPGGKTFTSGYVMTTNNTTPAMTVSSSQFTEIEYSVRSTAYTTAGTTYCFRLTNAGSTTNFTYTTQPQVSVTTSIVRPEAGGGGIGGETSGSGVQRTGGGSSGGGGVDSGGGGNPVGGGGPGGGGGGDIGFLYPFRTYLLGLSPRTFIISYPNLAFVYSFWLRN